MSDARDFETLQKLLTERRSCRGYLDDDVPRGTVEQILTAAQRTASWCNTQPWEVVIVSGQAKADLSKVLIESVVETFGQSAQPDFAFPGRYEGVYDTRRKEVGWQLYEAVGVERGDREASAMQMLRNFEFFGAPHVAIVTTEAELGVGTCAQAALAQVAPALRAHLGLPENRKIVCGIAFGRPDPAHPTAQFTSHRAPTETAVSYLQ